MIFLKIEDVSNRLGVSPSTIKKYYLLLEQKGFRFRRNNQSHVMFSEQDVMMFRKLIQLKNEPGITVNKAVEIIAQSVTDITDIIVTTDENVTNMKDMSVMTGYIEELKDVMLKQQELFVKQQEQINYLVSEQEENKKRLIESVSDRDKLLMESIRETQEVKKMILELNEKQNKKWWKIF